MNVDRVVTIVPPQFGAELHVARIASGISLAGLAHEAGVNRGHLKSFERGREPVSHNFYSRAILALADLLVNKEAVA